MIYEIYTSQLPIAITNVCNILIISNDSSRALIKTENIEGLNILNEYQESDFNIICSDLFWKQPCIDCEV